MPQYLASHQDLHCLLTEISMENSVKMKNLPETLKTKNGLIQMIRMNKSTSQKESKCCLNRKDIDYKGGA